MSNSTESLKVLLVDDEVDLLKATKKALEHRGFSVKTAQNGYEAMSSMELEKPDVVVLDILMPGINGEQTFYQMQDRWGNVPVIILTGHGTPAQAFLTAKRGVADYVHKPCDIDFLVSKIRAVTSTDREEPPERTGETASEIRVLVVDDEEEFLESLSRVLTRRGMFVVTAIGGVQALQLLQDQDVDVAVVDIKMPGMEGTELLERLKIRYPALEVIILTGHPSIDTAFRSTVQGAYEYLHKPPDIEELCSLIRRAFDKQERRREAKRQEAVRDAVDRFVDDY